MRYGCIKRIKTRQEKMQSVTSIPFSISTPFDSNSEHNVGVNFSAVYKPIQTKHRKRCIDRYISRIKEEVEEKEEGCEARAIKKGETKIRMKNLLNIVSRAVRCQIHLTSYLIKRALRLQQLQSQFFSLNFLFLVTNWLNILYLKSVIMGKLLLTQKLPLRRLPTTMD